MECLDSPEELFVKVIDDYSEREGEDLFETRSRRGIFAPALVMWLMIYQRLSRRQTLVGALESIWRGECDLVLSKNQRSKAIRERQISLGNSGLCRSRERLRVELARKVVNVLSRYLIERERKDYRWRGMTVVLVDGTRLTLPHTEDILEDYKPIRNQSREAYNPQLLCLCAHELFTGIAFAPRIAPHRGEKTKSETKLFTELVKDLPPNCLLIGDRLYGCFSAVYRAVEAGHDVLIRLTRTRFNAICKGEETGRDFAREVQWKITPNVAKAHDLPKETLIRGTVIQYTVRRKGYAPLVLRFFTTSKEPAADLVALYAKREHIENDIRSLKVTLGMERLNGKSSDIIEKEVLLGFGAYSLMRAVTARSAKKLGIQPRDISFSRAASLTQIYGNRVRNSTTAKERDKLLSEFLRGLNQSKLSHRTRYRCEPRKCVYHRSRFPLMKNSREEERALALALAKKSGHRGFMTTVSRSY